VEGHILVLHYLSDALEALFVLGPFL